MRAVLGDALMQRAHEIVVTPGADAGLLVRRDVGRIDRTERQMEREAAGEGLPPGMLWHAAQSAARTR